MDDGRQSLGTVLGEPRLEFLRPFYCPNEIVLYLQYNFVASNKID